MAVLINGLTIVRNADGADAAFYSTGGSASSIALSCRAAASEASGVGLQLPTAYWYGIHSSWLKILISESHTMTKPLQLLLLALFIGLSAGAVETAPLRVTHIVDGDTIDVEATPGVIVRVRLVGIDTPESHGNRHGEAMPEGLSAATALAELLPAGTPVRLWGPGDTLQRDRYGRVLAAPLLGATGWDSLEEHQIAAGWTVYWRKYGEIDQPELHQRWLAAEAAAHEELRGAWATIPDWMRNKHNERTAPSASTAAPAPMAVPDAPTTTTSSVEATEAGTSDRPSSAPGYWLNSASGVRHNSHCPYYEHTAQGRACSATEGRPCGRCGG